MAFLCIWKIDGTYTEVKWVIIGSGNGLLPVWQQAITWTNDDLLPFRPIGISLCQIYIKIRKISLKKIHLKMSSTKWRLFVEISIVSLTHWGQVMHICVSKLTIIGSDNGLSPGRHQAIIWTNGGILLIGPLGTNFGEMLIKIYTFSFKKMYLKMLFEKCQPFCVGLNVLSSGLLGPGHDLNQWWHLVIWTQSLA